MGRKRLNAMNSVWAPLLVNGWSTRLSRDGGKESKEGCPGDSPTTVQNKTIYTDLWNSRRNSLASRSSKLKPQDPSPKHSGKMVCMPISWSRGASHSLSLGKWWKHSCLKILRPQRGVLCCTNDLHGICGLYYGRRSGLSSVLHTVCQG